MLIPPRRPSELIVVTSDQHGEGGGARAGGGLRARVGLGWAPGEGGTRVAPHPTKLTMAETVGLIWGADSG